jgi:hypothetical protein
MGRLAHRTGQIWREGIRRQCGAQSYLLLERMKRSSHLVGSKRVLVPRKLGKEIPNRGRTETAVAPFSYRRILLLGALTLLIRDINVLSWQTALSSQFLDCLLHHFV